MAAKAQCAACPTGIHFGPTGIHFGPTGIHFGPTGIPFGPSASARIGAVAFIHRFGSSLNEHVHFHCCVIDGVFDPALNTHNEEGVVFHAATGLDTLAIADLQARARQRIHALIAKVEKRAIARVSCRSPVSTSKSS